MCVYVFLQNYARSHGLLLTGLTGHQAQTGPARTELDKPGPNGLKWSKKVPEGLKRFLTVPNNPMCIVKIHLILLLFILMYTFRKRKT